MSGHSEEPWHEMMGYADNGGMYCGISDKRGNEVCGEVGMDESDRRRVIACVNALQEIPTEELEAWSHSSAHWGSLSHIAQLIDRRRVAEKQRDQLREALQRIDSLRLSQFMGPHDMALECSIIASKALAAAGGE